MATRCRMKYRTRYWQFGQHARSDHEVSDRSAFVEKTVNVEGKAREGEQDHSEKSMMNMPGSP